MVQERSIPEPSLSRPLWEVEEPMPFASLLVEVSWEQHLAEVVVGPLVVSMLGRLSEMLVVFVMDEAEQPV